MKAKLHAGLHQLIEYVDELADEDNLKVQLDAERAVNARWKAEVEHQKEIIRLQQVKVEDVVAQLEQLQLTCKQDAVTIGELRTEVELSRAAELKCKEVQTNLQLELTKYKAAVAQLEQRTTTLSAELDRTHKRVADLETVQEQVAALEAAKTRILELEAVQHRETELTAQVTKLEVQLQQEFVKRSSPAQLAGTLPSVEKTTVELQELQTALNMKTARIDQREAQLRTLGMRNEQLREQLEGPDLSEVEEDAEVEEDDATEGADEAAPMDTDAGVDVLLSEPLVLHHMADVVTS